MTPAQALRHPWLRRKLPKPPSENGNPNPSRRSSANYSRTNQNATVPKLNKTNGQPTNNSSNVLNNSSNTVNRNNAANDPDLNKHTKLPKIGNGSNNNLRTGS
jgi:dual specificity tyrosine-phosphorylation-regulated kinase 2/3/4